MTRSVNELQMRHYSGYGGGDVPLEESKVHTLLLKINVKLRELASREEGQDIVEYALVFGLLCLGATAGTRFLATGLAGAYGNLSSTLGGYTG